MTPADADLLLRDVIGGGLDGHRAADLALALREDATGHGTMWQLLRVANMVPHVALVLEAQRLADRLSPAQADFVADAARTNAVRQSLLLRRATDTTRALAAHGITAAWIKGAWMAACIVERPAMRVMEDIDLVVSPDAFDRATQVLGAEGFCVEASATIVDERIPARSFTRRDDIPGGDGRLHLDLHCGIGVTPAHARNNEAFWGATTNWQVRGHDIVGPTHAAGLVLAAQHAFKHGYDARHRWAALADAAAILRAAGPSLDVRWLIEEIADPLVAVALHALFALSSPVLFDADGPARAVRDAAARRVKALRLHARIGSLVRQASNVPPIAQTDFSLMAVGEQGSPWQAMRQLLAALARRRQRERHGDVPRSGAAGRVATLARANWRYAYTTFLAGRLVARVHRSDGD